MDDRDREERAFQVSPLALAYVGDAVWELAVRQMLVERGERRPRRLHGMAVRYVQAGGQADRLSRVFPLLTEREQSVVMRGRNAKSASVPRSATVGEYRLSTGLEALLGYLYLSGKRERLDEMMGVLLSETPAIKRDGASGTPEQ